MSDLIVIRVASKTEPGEFRVVSIATGRRLYICSCTDQQNILCSHIDAVIRCGERFMVHPEDHDAADVAMAAMAQHIEVPPDWMASWKRDKRWRGIAVKERAAPTKPVRVRDKSLPLVAFTGQGPRSRTEYIETARADGWEVTGSSSPALTLLVAGSGQSSAKLKIAMKNGIRIVSYSEWEDIINRK